MIDNSPESVASVLKVFGILQTLSEEKDIGITELSQKMMMSKSTIYRFLQTMKTLGYVNQEGEADKYSLSLKLYELSNKAFDNQNFLSIADIEMRKLRELTKETIHLAVREYCNIVYINKVASEQYSLCLGSKIGNQVAIHASGLGKILLTWLDKETQQNIINEIEFAQFTPKTITTAKQFIEELEEVKNKGFAEDNEESELGLHCFAVPIYNRAGTVFAALSLSTSIFRCDTKEKEEQLVSELHKTASEISKKMGFQDKYPFLN